MLKPLFNWQFYSLEITYNVIYVYIGEIPLIYTNTSIIDFSFVRKFQRSLIIFPFKSNAFQSQYFIGNILFLPLLFMLGSLPKHLMQSFDCIYNVCKVINIALAEFGYKE